ncbi:MAG: DUF1566 domain-containing protein, partial [Deltaproteobacteria bacterium]|nr:DUF1566 domain-containing protein [Deltaproteobacteria bacterium]
ADRKYGGDRDQLVSMMEMAGYVREGISEWSLEQRNRQRPYIKISGGMENVIVSSVEKQAPLFIGRTVDPAPAIDKDLKFKKSEPVKMAAKVRGPEIGRRLKEKLVIPGVKKEDESRDVILTRKEGQIKITGSEKRITETEIGQPRPGEKVPEKKLQVAAPAPQIEDLMDEKKSGTVDQPTRFPETGLPDLERDDKMDAEKGVTTTPTMPPRDDATMLQPAPETAVEDDVAPQVPEWVAEAQIKGTENTGKGATKPVTPGKIVEGTSREEAESQTKGTDQPFMEEKRVAAISPAPKREPVSLRISPQELSPKDVKAMLLKYRFYATCWNYNGEFCNPDGEFQNVFMDNKDGTVTDEATGLMWQKGGSPSPMTWMESKAYVTELNSRKFAGYSDWRLPTSEELASLMENSWKNADLFIDPVFEVKQRYCWSMDIRDLNKAWKANFHLGFIMDFTMNSKNFVRVVRSLK